MDGSVQALDGNPQFSAMSQKKAMTEKVIHIVARLSQPI